MFVAGAQRRVWCLNLDAEDELRRGPGYTPSQATEAAVAAARPLASGLVGANDLTAHDLHAPLTSVERQQYRGEAWCPTPRALRVLAALGVTLPAAPPFDALRAVNASRFPYDVLGARLDESRVLHAREELEAFLCARPPASAALLKRAYGAAGRGKLRVAAGRLTPPARAFLTDAELVLGVVVEPWVRIVLEVSQHGWLAQDGALTLGQPCVQHVVGGRFVSVRRALPSELSVLERQTLVEAARTLAAAMHARGYFGPFGVDAYRYEDARGARRWNPCGELNARYTMGYAAGMEGLPRPDASAPSC
ncbi:MAG: hypothetical protein R3B40_03670 [Polyangiales bacterium]|nr:hypothetical protein [Myxococcales bacterium]MCB9661175.1 hypothetical protein [Sandaracinaceae bacterium]